MSYMAAQTLLKALLVTCGSLGASNVTEGDLRVLDSGLTNTAVIFPGILPVMDLATLVRVREYEAIVDLFTKFVDDTAYSTFGTLRDAVIATIMGGRDMSGTYFITALASDGEPTELFDKQGAGPFFVNQRFRLVIQEQV